MINRNTYRFRVIFDARWNPLAKVEEKGIRVQNVVSPINPKTSALAVLSAIATLKMITEGFQIGT